MQSLAWVVFGADLALAEDPSARRVPARFEARADGAGWVYDIWPADAADLRWPLLRAIGARGAESLVVEVLPRLEQISIEASIERDAFSVGADTFGAFRLSEVPGVAEQYARLEALRRRDRAAAKPDLIAALRSAAEQAKSELADHRAVEWVFDQEQAVVVSEDDYNAGEGQLSGILATVVIRSPPQVHRVAFASVDVRLAGREATAFFEPSSDGTRTCGIHFTATSGSPRCVGDTFRGGCLATLPNLRVVEEPEIRCTDAEPSLTVVLPLAGEMWDGDTTRWRLEPGSDVIVGSDLRALRGATTSSERLPEAPNLEELPPADVVLRAGEGCSLQVVGVAGSFPCDAEELTSPDLVEAIRAAVPTPRSARARFDFPPDLPFLPVRQAVSAVNVAGIPFCDFAGGPTGETGLSVEEHLSGPGREPPTYPLMVHLRADRVTIGRTPGTDIDVALPAGPERDAVVEALLDADRRLYPDADTVILVTDDSVVYGEMFAALAATRAHGYTTTMLGGGPDTDRAPIRATPPLPEGPWVAPTHVRIEPNGTFVTKGPASRFSAETLSHFLEDCAAEPCALVAVPRTGPPVLVGAREQGDDPARAWIFGRSVYPAPGYTRSAGVPTSEGAFAPFPVVRGAE